MPDQLALKLMATPTLQVPTIGLGDLSSRGVAARRDIDALASMAQRRAWTRQGLALSNGTFPIPNVPYLRLALSAYGFAANRPQARRWITRRAKQLEREDVLPDAWREVTAAATEFERNNLEVYWKTGEGAAKIRWGTPGDFTRCHKHLRDKVVGSERICAQWHYDMNGYWPGDKKNLSLGIDDFPEHQKCAYGDEPATKRIIHSEAMAYIPVCEAHLDEGKTDAANCTPDGSHDPSNIVRIDEITTATEEGHPMPEAVTASADAGWSEEYAFFWNDGTGEVFRVAGETVETFIDGAWTATDVTLAEVQQLPSVDDPETLQAIVGSVLAGEEVNLPEGAGAKFRIPVVIPEGVPSGDRREFSAGALEFKEPPMPLMWQKVTAEGHDNSVTVGKITHVERLESGGLGNAEGVFDTHADAVEAARQVKEKFLTGVSGDVDNFECTLAVDDDGQESMLITKGRLVGATLVSKPAFQEAHIEFVSDDAEEQPVILASAGPIHPPRAWFENPQLTEPTQLTVTEDGRVFGHIAAWGQSHMGNPSIKPPRSATGYKYFNRRPVRTSEGVDVNTGQLTLTGGHADLNLSVAKTMAHYDDTRSAVADVVAGEDEFGIWVAGAMRPDITDFQVRAFRASEPSGDWRLTDDGLELVAVCQVNTPGFPVLRPRTLVASGRPIALVAAGTMELRNGPIPGLAEIVASLAQRLEVLEKERRAERAAALLASAKARLSDTV